MRYSTAPETRPTRQDAKGLPILRNSSHDASGSWSATLREVSIRSFRTGDAAAFRALNEAWITRWFYLEPEDVRVLNDPEGQILGVGGHIFVAVLREQVVGCCALLPLPNRKLRLVRMAVEEELRGRGIGRLLLKAAVEKAQALGALRITLETSTKLPGAIHLYASMGFDRVTPAPEQQERLQRADVFMELALRYG